MAEKHNQSMMDNLYWWGIPTLFRCPNEEPEDKDIALVGVPHSTGNGTTERDQHLGPRALRNVSALGRRFHNEFNLDPWGKAKIADVGDVPFPQANNNEHCIEQITNFYRGRSFYNRRNSSGSRRRQSIKRATDKHSPLRCPYGCFYQGRSFPRSKKISGTLGCILS